MMSRIKATVIWWRNLKAKVAEAVLEVEKEFAGKSGEEKRAVVVKRLDDLIKLPWWLDDLLDLDGKLIGYLVGQACDALNILTDGDFSDVEIDPEMLAVVAEAPIEAVNQAHDAVTAKATKQQTVNERLEELYKQFGVAAEAVADIRGEDDDIGAALGAPPIRKDEKWDRCIAIVGVAEGGANFDVVGGVPVLKAKNRNDKGSPTKYGITQATLAGAYAKGVVGHGDIVKLTKEEAGQIYRTMYCDPYGWLELPFEPCLCLLDATINHGLGGTAKISQRACNAAGYEPALVVDGKWGPRTKAAVWMMAKENPQGFAREFLVWRKDYYDRIIAADTSQTVFEAGWHNRLRRIARECGDI